MNNKNINKLIEDALAIEATEAKEAGALGFMARALVQATLPHSNPGDVNAWGRENGAFSMVMQPGIIQKNGELKSIGLPYGSIPRLVLAWITTEAVKTKSRELILGNSLSQFMHALDIVPTGGRWGSIDRLKTQMKRLFSASISCTYEDGDNWGIRKATPVERADLWWDPKNPNQATVWESSLLLTESFFTEIIDRPVPIDMRALKSLKKSPMALDIYCWLTYRMSYLHKKTGIPWQALAAQFGSNYANDAQGIRNFKRHFIDQLKKVNCVYPDIKIDYDSSSLILMPSKTHIKSIIVNS